MTLKTDPALFAPRAARASQGLTPFFTHLLSFLGWHASHEQGASRFPRLPWRSEPTALAPPLGDALCHARRCLARKPPTTEDALAPRLAARPVYPNLSESRHPDSTPVRNHVRFPSVLRTEKLHGGVTAARHAPTALDLDPPLQYQANMSDRHLFVKCILTLLTAQTGCSEPGTSHSCEDGVAGCAPNDGATGEVDTADLSEQSDVPTFETAEDAQEVDAIVPGDVATSCERPVEAQLGTGVVSLTANLEALPIWLHLYLDLAVDRATGELAGIGTFARLQTRNPAVPPSYDDPEAFELPLDDTGWAFYFVGCATSTEAGRLLVTSEPVDLRLTALGAVHVVLEGLVIQASITSRPNDREIASGTLTISGGSYGEPPNQIEPINTTWTGYGLRPSELVAALPRVCEVTPCAEIEAAGGTCSLPTPYDPGPLCTD